MSYFWADPKLIPNAGASAMNDSVLSEVAGHEFMILVDANGITQDIKYTRIRPMNAATLVRNIE